MRKIQQVRQLTLAVIAVYLAIFGLLHFFCPFRELVYFQKRAWVAPFQMFSAFRFLCTAGCSPPSMCGPSPGLPRRPRGPRPACTGNRHRSELQRGGQERREGWGVRRAVCKSLSGLHQEALVYGWLKPLGLKFYILDRGAAFDCCNYLPLYVSA